MRLDSVISLKMELADRSSDEDAATTPMGLVQLGIAPRQHNQFSLAIRMRAPSANVQRLIALIDKEARGEIDLRAIGAIRKCGARWQKSRQRPLRIGCSISHCKVTAGTLGAFVIPHSGGALALLSNNHILANENRAHEGDPILQQATQDGGLRAEDAVARLGKFVRLKFRGINHTDCAIAPIRKNIDCAPRKLTGLGTLKGIGDPVIDQGKRVVKIGRTTGVRRGRVTAFALDNVVIEYDNGFARFDDQIEIEGTGDTAFCDAGDSGSLVVGSDMRAVALLFAGSDQGGRNNRGLAYANPIRAVLDALKVDLAL